MAGMRLLIVDDNQHEVALLRDALGPHAPVAITVAPDGQAALDILPAQSGQFDLIVVDWRLPDIAGDELAAKLSECSGNGAPVVVISSALPGNVSARLQSTGIAVLPKPMDLEGYAELAIALAKIAQAPLPIAHRKAASGTD